MSTTTNFFEGVKLADTPVTQEVFFRLYYTDDTITYSMEELEGDYIEITCEQFARADCNIFVKDGKIFNKQLITIGKLVPTSNPNGTDITLIDKNAKVKWVMKTYE